MDDGSDDDTHAIVNNVNDSRIRYYNYGRIGITGILKNKGIALSKGELIAFMDSDDLWPPLKLEKQATVLINHKAAGFSYTNGYNFHENTITEKLLTQTDGIEVCNMFTSYCKGERGVFIQTIMLRKECIEKTGLFIEKRTFSDFRFIGDLSYHFDVVILYEPLLQRRLHTSNSISLYGKELYEEYIETIKYYLRNNILSKQVYRDSAFKCYINGITAADNMAERMKNYINAVYIKPLSIIPLKKLIKSFLYK
jgi:glycosyltransferase involved in cell wall biosynthesis